MIRTREEILRDIQQNINLTERFYSWKEEQREEFLDFCTGVKGVKMLYDAFFKEIMNPETHVIYMSPQGKTLTQKRAKELSQLELETAIPAQLEALRKDLYERALANREKRTWAATTMEEVKELAKANTGYIKTMWCGDLACEMKMKEEAGLSSRCMPFEQEHLSDVCPCCGKPASKMVYWGVAY